MKIKMLVFLAACQIILFPINNFAFQSLDMKAIDHHLDKLSIDVALGYLGGESNEYVCSFSLCSPEKAVVMC
jgi:plasminogen activator